MASELTAGRAAFAASLGLWGMLSPGAAAVEWASNTIKYMDGAGYELGSSRNTIVDWEHFSGYRYGENYFFFDISHREQPGTRYYGEFYTFLSLSKIFGRDFSVGPIGEIMPAAGLNAGGEPFEDDFTAYLLGASAHLEVPGFRILQIEAYAYYVDQVGVQITPIWNLPFKLGASRWIFRGFFDFRDGNATGGSSEIFGQPEIMLDLGHFWGRDDKLLVGMRWDYARNLHGLSGVDQDAQQAILSWTF